jgi:hypothetical protein
VDITDIKCHFQWWEKHKSMFLNNGFLARQILGIVRFHIETKKDFLFHQHINKLKKMSLSHDQFEKVDICEQKLT